MPDEHFYTTQKMLEKHQSKHKGFMMPRPKTPYIKDKQGKKHLLSLYARDQSRKQLIESMKRENVIMPQSTYSKYEQEYETELHKEHKVNIYCQGSV